MENISIVIPAHNNLEHLKNCYKSVRKYYPKVELILMDDASDDKTFLWMVELADKNAQIYNTQQRRGHTILYDRGIEMATKEIVGILHADMIISENFLENIVKNLRRRTVVCGTRVEPPLHPSGKEKIIKNFGMDWDSLDIEAFESFAKRMEKQYEGETTTGMFAPWFIYKEDFEAMGGHDHIFAPFPYEDSDIFQRWILEGYELIQARDAFVYHLTCRGHRWTEEIGKDDDEYEKFEKRARRNYIRKWGSWIQNDDYHHPVIHPKFDIGFVAENVTELQFYNLEPWCSDIYVHESDVPESWWDSMTDVEQDLYKDKIHHIKAEKTNDVIVEFDGSDLNKDLFNNFITNINKIVHNAEQTGEFVYGPFNVHIKKKEPFTKKHFQPIYKTDEYHPEPTKSPIKG